MHKSDIKKNIEIQTVKIKSKELCSTSIVNIKIESIWDNIVLLLLLNTMLEIIIKEYKIYIIYILIFYQWKKIKGYFYNEYFYMNKELFFVLYSLVIVALNSIKL